MIRVSGGDTTALASLIQRHKQHVLALAYRTLGRWHTAEDIAQETFLRVWRAAPNYRPTALFTTWLHRIVVNLCLDEMRKRKPDPTDPPDLSDGGRGNPANALERDDRAAAVRRAVDRLPERQRVAVVLQRFSDMPVKEISQATGWSESAVESLLVRAYRALRESLQDFARS